MLRLMGAIMTAAACAWVGFRGAERLKHRYGAIRELEQGLLLLEQELELCDPPLPELMEKLAAETGGCAGVLFSRCAGGLGRLSETTFSRVWEEAVLECGVCTDILLPLGRTLGRCDGAAQRRALSAVRLRLDGQARLVQEDCRRQSGVYRILGVSGGAFLVILLL